MSADILQFGGITYLDLPADTILEKAKGELESVVVIGFDKDGGEYFASSAADGGEVLWHLERAKQALLRVDDDGDAA